MQKERSRYRVWKPRYKLAVFRLRARSRNRAPLCACCLPLSSEWNFPRRETRRPRPQYRYLRWDHWSDSFFPPGVTHQNLTIFVIEPPCFRKMRKLAVTFIARHCPKINIINWRRKSTISWTSKDFDKYFAQYFARILWVRINLSAAKYVAI